jgi:hypothetical protein
MGPAAAGDTHGPVGLAGKGGKMCTAGAVGQLEAAHMCVLAWVLPRSDADSMAHRQLTAIFTPQLQDTDTYSSAPHTQHMESLPYCQ